MVSQIFQSAGLWKIFSLFLCFPHQQYTRLNNSNWLFGYLIDIQIVINI